MNSDDQDAQGADGAADKRSRRDFVALSAAVGLAAATH